jgi:hypothetical protein
LTGKQLMLMKGTRIGLVLVADDDEGLSAVMAVLAIKLIEELPEGALDGLLFIAVDRVDLRPPFPLLVAVIRPARRRLAWVQPRAKRVLLVIDIV